MQAVEGAGPPNASAASSFDKLRTIGGGLFPLTLSLSKGAHRVNMTPEGAYLLRRHPEGHEFRTAWEAALKLGVQRLEDVAAIRFAQQIGTSGHARSMASKSRSITSARSSARGGSITTAR